MNHEGSLKNTLWSICIVYITKTILENSVLDVHPNFLGSSDHICSKMYLLDMVRPCWQDFWTGKINYEQRNNFWLELTEQWSDSMLLEITFNSNVTFVTGSGLLSLPWLFFIQEDLQPRGQWSIDNGWHQFSYGFIWSK